MEQPSLCDKVSATIPFSFFLHIAYMQLLLLRYLRFGKGQGKSRYAHTHSLRHFGGALSANRDRRKFVCSDSSLGVGRV